MKNISLKGVVVTVGILLAASTTPATAQWLTPPAVPSTPPAVPGSSRWPAGLLSDGTFSHSLSATPQNPQHAAEHVAALRQANAQTLAAQDALRAGDFAAAEAGFREAIAAQDLPWSYAGLAQALAGQGRVTEAIQVYHDLFFDLPVRRGINSTDPQQISAYRAKIAQSPTLFSFGSDSFSAWMNYALLLNSVGRWGEAVSVYEKALPQLGKGSLPTVDVHFDPAVPDGVQFAAAAHLSLGIDASNRLEHNVALREYERAVSLQPDAPLVNYYYGRGLRRLGRTAEAKAAFHKAARADQDDVKQAAEKALAGL